MIPTRYPRERRTPWVEPAAVRLIVAGPGLLMIVSDVIKSGPIDSQWTVAPSCTSVGGISGTRRGAA
jgi:hypothetical protein